MRNTNSYNPHERLANEIVLQAVKDYRSAKKKLKRKPWDMDSRRVVKEVERFFYSSYFGILTDADPEFILERLKREVVR